MDQFAAGLVGTRSPYGTPKNAFDDRFIPGGSSSGSAPLVASGLVTFALGTDTAGSGMSPQLMSCYDNLWTPSRKAAGLLGQANSVS